MLTPLAPLLNLAAVPWSAVVLLAGFAWCAVGTMSSTAARALAPLLDLLAAPFGWPQQVRGTVALAGPLAASPVAATVLAAGLWTVARWPRRLLPAALLASGALLAGRLAAPEAVADPEVLMLDVGQGDAVLLRHGRRAVLVDGGGWEGGDLGGSVLLPALLGEGLARLDAVVLTHGDIDHCRGLVEIADYLPVAEVWAAPGLPASACARELLALPGPRRRVLWTGERRAVGAWSFLAVHPGAGQRTPGNDGSLALLAEARGRRVLLTGDLGAAAELRLVRRAGEKLAADVLKVAHHGSRTSSTRALLAAVRPHLALISAGRGNRYGHPAAEVVSRLGAARAWVLRTDLDGQVRVRIGRGGALAVSTEGRR
jgi:competence protein ComEC